MTVRKAWDYGMMNDNRIPKLKENGCRKTVACWEDKQLMCPLTRWLCARRGIMAQQMPVEFQG